jgi:hypothetical protein
MTQPFTFSHFCISDLSLMDQTHQSGTTDYTWFSPACSRISNNMALVVLFPEVPPTAMVFLEGSDQRQQFATLYDRNI